MGDQQTADHVAWTAWQVWKQHLTDLAAGTKKRSKTYFYRHDGSCMNPDKVRRAR